MEGNEINQNVNLFSLVNLSCKKKQLKGNTN